MSHIDRGIEFRPFVAALAGPPLVGKTSLGLELAGRTNLRFVDNGPLLPAKSVVSEPRLVRSMVMTEMYARAHVEAARHLVRGKPVLLAATYSYGAYVDMLRRMADYFGELTHSQEKNLIIFALEAPEESFAERSVARRARNDKKYFPDVSLEEAIDLRRRYVPIRGEDVIKIDTGLTMNENIDQILAALEPFRRS